MYVYIEQVSVSVAYLKSYAMEYEDTLRGAMRDRRGFMQRTSFNEGIQSAQRPPGEQKRLVIL